LSVAVDDGAYLAYLDRGFATQIAQSQSDLVEHLRRVGVPPYNLVPTHVIVDRLQADGKLVAARAALDAADLYTRERWNNRDAIYADDPAALALLNAIGADPLAILAPG
jgi:hypothetical protein